jgi:hypothetical protein
MEQLVIYSQLNPARKSLLDDATIAVPPDATIAVPPDATIALHPDATIANTNCFRNPDYTHLPVKYV